MLDRLVYNVKATHTYTHIQYTPAHTGTIHTSAPVSPMLPQWHQHNGEADRKIVEVKVILHGKESLMKM